jgi:hypothetical protein
MHSLLGQQTVQQEHSSGSVPVQSAHKSNELSSASKHTPSGTSPVSLFCSSPKPAAMQEFNRESEKLHTTEKLLAASASIDLLRLLNSSSSGGTEPVSWFWNRYSCLNSVSSPKHSGIGPFRLFVSRKSASMALKSQSSRGMVPIN